MNDNLIYKQTAKMTVFLALSIIACKVTGGYILPLFALIGIWCAFANKLGWALVYFVMMPFFVILNGAVAPKSGAICMYALRFGPLLIGLILAARGASRQGRHRLPFGSILPFLMVACISSADGWAPQVSYMKIVNFIVFLFGIWYGTQNLQHRPQDVFLLRSFFLAIAVILVFGSIVLIPVPSISYATSLGDAMQKGGTELANEVFQSLQLEGTKILFCGITNQSQALALLLGSVGTLVLCDMLFLERCFRKPHVILIVCLLPLLYFTRSRVALVTMLFSMTILFVYTSQKVKLPQSVRSRLGQGMMIGAVLIVIAAGIVQARSGTMSAWLRKADISEDKRSLGEALTQSRMGLMEQSIQEFKRNPLIGSGFQVAWYTRDMVKGTKGLVLSASIEKGVLPVMVLGETGILGAAMFLVFLLMFWFTCARRGYYITITLFAVLLVTNMGEATFFSPGGSGGILWMISTVGGFALDTTLIYRNDIMRQWAQMGAPPPNAPPQIGRVW